MAKITITGQNFGASTVADNAGVDVDQNLLSIFIVEITALQRDLSVAPDLDSVRSAVQRTLPNLLRPTPLGVYQVLVAALRVVELICESIDRLMADGVSTKTGAFRDTGLYRPCGNSAVQSTTEGHRLAQLVPMILIATDYLQKLGGFSKFAGVVMDLVPASVFREESDDHLIHRCLLASHALAEVYVRAVQGQLPATSSPRASHPPRYPKEDVKKAVVQTARGPVLGHHSIMILNNATVCDQAMCPRLAFISYRENLCFFYDWQTAKRSDADILTDLGGWISKDTPAEPAWTTMPYPWRARNDIGNKLTRFVAALDHISKDASNVSLTHSGVLCSAPTWRRKVIIASAGYGSYGFWNMPWLLVPRDYAELVSAGIGAMVRGWAIDHDTEASIGEHNLLNWVCRACATTVSRETLSPANAAAARADWAMRLAWGPFTYFYFSRRHQGFARRVDNLLEESTAAEHISIKSITPSCSPIVAGDSVSVIVSKLLALCGVALGDSEAELQRLVNETDWNCQPRICSRCDFKGFRAQAFMVSVGVTRLATRLPEVYRNNLVDLLETYGCRLFPAIQSRLLVQCACLPVWMADVMSCGYTEAGTRCGQSDCSIATGPPRRSSLVPTDERSKYDGVYLTEWLLRQASVEAKEYADRTGQAAWFKVVSEPL